jgi:hypothetical protein
MCGDSVGALEEGYLIASERLQHEAIHLPAGLQIINLETTVMYDACQHGFWEGAVLPFNLLFGAPLMCRDSMTDPVVDLIGWLHGIPQYTCQHLKAASDRLKAHSDHVARSTRFQEGNQSLVVLPDLDHRHSFELQPSWEGLYKVITKISDEDDGTSGQSSTMLWGCCG